MCHPNYAPHRDINSNINPNLENNQTTNLTLKQSGGFCLDLTGHLVTFIKSAVKWIDFIFLSR